MRVDDGEPAAGHFGKMGRLADPDTGRLRVCRALLFTPVVSRSSFVWLTHRQSLDDVITGFEATRVLDGGVRATAGQHEDDRRSG